MKKFIPIAFSAALLAASLPAHADSNTGRYGEDLPAAANVERQGQPSARSTSVNPYRNGEASIPAAATRTVVVGPGTRWVNVSHDEIVRFVSSGQEFSWHFDGMAPRVSLREIAPSAFSNTNDVMVYVGSTAYPVGD